MIHHTAIVDPDAVIPDTAEVGPFAVIEAGVRVGENCRIAAHAVLKTGTVLSHDVQVFEHAVIGGLPQDVHFDPKTITYVKVGAGTVIREQVTLNRATREDGATIVGRNCYLMAYSHAGHDCQLGDNVILTNNVMLAGHVHVGDHTVFGGASGIHQFVRIGEGVMLSGMSAITKDVAPFTMTAGRDQLIGLNLVGMKRRNVPRESIREVKRLLRAVCAPTANPRELAQQETAETPEGQRFLSFFVENKRGYLRLRREVRGQETPQTPPTDGAEA